MEVTKTNLILIPILLMCSLAVVAQTETKINKKLRSCWEMHDRSINKYADSLNFLGSGKPLPSYLDDYLMDWRLKDSMYPCLKNNDERISFRKSIIDRVINEDALVLIVNSINNSYDRRYDPEKLRKERNSHSESFPEIKYMDKSWRDLAKKRLVEIKEQRDRFK
jgi:hypothetical protein